jgi:hypothetical protein
MNRWSRVIPRKITEFKTINIMNDFFHVLMPVAILGSLGTSLYFFTKVLTDYILKKKMIEKGYMTEESQAIFKSYKNEGNKLSSLKWGLIVLCGGIGLIIIDALGVTPDSPLPYGVFAVSLSIGFLSYYFMVRNEAK